MMPGSIQYDKTERDRALFHDSRKSHDETLNTRRTLCYRSSVTILFGLGDPMTILRTAALAAAAAIVGFSANAATVLETFRVNSHFEANDASETPEHSLWFSGSDNPDGTVGPKGNHFLFENASPGFGLFTIFDDNTATVTGNLANAAGQTFAMTLNLIGSTNPGTHKVVGSADPNTWDYYVIDTADGNESTLTYVGDNIGPDDGDLDNFEITLRGAPLEVQVGIGANDKNELLFGLSTWIYLTETTCDGINDRCTRYSGDINVLLEPIPLPPSMALMVAGLGGIGLMARRRRKS